MLQHRIRKVKIIMINEYICMYIVGIILFHFYNLTLYKKSSLYMKYYIIQTLYLIKEDKTNINYMILYTNTMKVIILKIVIKLERK